ncbi:hypothetical protein [Aquimarina sp. SS2-1]|uniref:hypothetical protein n=1 Tax=Aquimarina besae TaxID=3342247 RepID=UPI0036720AE6
MKKTMFWKRNTKTIKDTTKQSIEHRLFFIERLMGIDWLQKFRTFNLNDFEVDLSDQKETAQVVFDKIKESIGLKEALIALDFFWENPVKPKDPFAILKTADLFKNETLTIGKYREDKVSYIISIKMLVLRNHNLLIFTIAHELAHYILQGQKQLFFNDEKLTDLLVLAMGFESFWCELHTHKKENKVTSIGYLSKGEGMYALACLQH